MKIFKDYTMPWYDTAVLKVTMLLLGVCIGTRWHEILVEFRPVLFPIVLVGLIYLAYRYFPKVFS